MRLCNVVAGSLNLKSREESPTARNSLHLGKMKDMYAIVSVMKADHTFENPILASSSHHSLPYISYNKRDPSGD
jgi:hypothetical protein